MYSSKDLKLLAQKACPEATAFRRELHMYPELSQQEESTAERILSKLSSLNIPCERNIAGHGVMGIIKGKDPHKAIALRADMDGLPIVEKASVPYGSQNPGVMHACGHDIHMAVLYGTAIVLSQLQDLLPFSVKLLFQPAEETTGGAKEMIQAGCLKDPETAAVVGLHVDPFVPVGKILLPRGVAHAASCEFSVTVRGKGCHGAEPYTGKNPLLPCCVMISGIYSHLCQRLNPAEPYLLSVGQMQAGCKSNIIPDQAVFKGIIRALTLERRTLIKKILTDFCNRTAEAYGVTNSIVFSDTYPPLENHSVLYDLIKSCFSQVLGPQNLMESNVPAFTSDDFSWFCRHVPGFYYRLGAAHENGQENYPLHSPFFKVDEGCIYTGILTETAATLHLLNEFPPFSRKKADL